MAQEAQFTTAQNIVAQQSQDPALNGFESPLNALNSSETPQIDSNGFETLQNDSNRLETIINDSNSLEMTQNVDKRLETDSITLLDFNWLGESLELDINMSSESSV